MKVKHAIEYFNILFFFKAAE